MTKHNIAVIGVGYVGLVTGVCLAELGHTVTCVDIDEEKIAQLRKGIATIYEPGIEELLARNISSGRIKFSTNGKQAIADNLIVFSSVGTPMGESYQADLQYVKQVADLFAEAIKEYKILVTKSTVPVGTGEMLQQRIKRKTDVDFDVVSNPEFLKEGAAIEDFMKPDRIVVGCETDKSQKVLEELYQPIVDTGAPLIMTDIKSAELIKYAANSMLATRISFMNEIARFCDLVGADVVEVSKGVGLDERIGPRFLNAGIGYGGSCFPKDVMALVASGEQQGLHFQILNAAHDVNSRQVDVFMKKLLKQFDNLKGKKIAVWGLAFKPKTDDVRDAPSRAIIEKVLANGASVTAFDPVAMNSFQESYDLDIAYANSKYEATKGANALLLLTEWEEFKKIDYSKLKTMKEKVIIDGRNVLTPKVAFQNKFNYQAIGRPSA